MTINDPTPTDTTKRQADTYGVFWKLKLYICTVVLR